MDKDDPIPEVKLYRRVTASWMVPESGENHLPVTEGDRHPTSAQLVEAIEDGTLDFEGYYNENPADDPTLAFQVGEVFAQQQLVGKIVDGERRFYGFPYSEEGHAAIHRALNSGRKGGLDRTDLCYHCMFPEETETPYHLPVRPYTRTGY